MIGNISSVTETTGAGSSTRQYAYAPSGPDSVRPHAVTRAGDDTFAYNGAGQMTSRTVEGVTSELDWNGQNRVSRITRKRAGGDEVSTYVYDVSGNVLMRSSVNEKVLYLDGHELRASAATTATQATRYYSAGDTVVAMRTPSDTEEDGVLVWLMSDGQASTQLMILAATGAVTRRRYTPFGDQRGEASLPAGTDRGFLGKPEDDATGLSILGARMYDAALGRFLSPDELITPYDPQNLSSHSYSVNNPVAFSDPSGLDPINRSCAKAKDRTACYNESYSGPSAKVGGSEGPVRACRCERRQSLYDSQGNPRKRKGLGGIPGARPIVINSGSIPSPPPHVAPAPPKIDVPVQNTGVSSIVGGFAKDKIGKVWDTFWANDTGGMCLSGSIGFGTGVAGEACIVKAITPDGKVEYGHTVSKGMESPSLGTSIQLGAMGSNADGIAQLKGDGWGGTVSAGYGAAASVTHERAIGTANTRGESVGVTTVSVGGGVGAEFGITTSVNTEVGKWFTLDEW